MVQSASASTAAARTAAWWALGRLQRCPEEDFAPTTPVGFVVAGWNETGNADRFGAALELLLAHGCDINASDQRGLTPLHSAILFNNTPAARRLLELGADSTLTTAIDARAGVQAIVLDAADFAAYLDELGGEDRAAIAALLAAGAARGAPDHPGRL